MDIPKLPTDAIITKSASSSSAMPALTLENIVPLEQLNLAPGKTYQAKVMSSLVQLLDTLNQGSPTNANLNQSSAANAKNQYQDNWIILVQNRLINILSQRPLSTGDQLTLRLEASNLVVKNHIPVQKAPQATSSTGTTSGQTIDSTQQSTLLKNMNQLINNQTDLAYGMKRLALTEAHIKNTSTSSPLFTQLKEALVSQLPQKTTLLNQLNVKGEARSAALEAPAGNPDLPSQQARPANNQDAAASAIRATLEKAGLSFENSLLKQRDVISSFEKLIVSPPLKQPTGTTASPVNLQLNPTSTPNKLAPQSPQRTTDVTTAAHPIITKAKALINSLASTPKDTALPVSDTPKDLKALLLAITSSLVGSGENLKPLEGLANPELKMPFSFPPLTDTSLVKASAIMADQDLSTGQLLKLMAGMLNRIQFNQLNSLYQSQTMAAESNTNTQTWFFEIPIAAENKTIDVFNVRIDKEEQQANQGEEQEDKTIQWRVALSFDFESLGRIYIQANITPPAVSSTIWANNTATLALINKEQYHFRDRLAQLGLDVGDIICQYGQPNQNRAKLDKSLVDIQA